MLMLLRTGLRFVGFRGTIGVLERRKSRTFVVLEDQLPLMRDRSFMSGVAVEFGNHALTILSVVQLAERQIEECKLFAEGSCKLSFPLILRQRLGGLAHEFQLESDPMHGPQVPDWSSDKLQLAQEATGVSLS
jgi:hypothetical protein